MKIIYMGTPELAIPPLESIFKSPHEILRVVTQPDRPKGRGKKTVPPPVKVKAQEMGLKIEQPISLKDPDFTRDLASLGADLIVVVAFSILPLSVIECARLGAVNLHASLLPRYRGAAPVQWALYHGEHKTGVSIFQLDAKMDHGQLLGQVEVSIDARDTAGSLGDKIISAGKTLMLDVLDQIEGNRQNPIEQDHTLATPARKLKKEDGRLGWNRSALENYNHIRAFNPYPICYTNLPELKNKVLRIHSAEVTAIPSTGPGQVQISEDGYPMTGCSDFFLKLNNVQLEGKHRVAGNSFVNGIKSHTNLTRMDSEG